ncbi:MAG: hypothetical protein OXC06_09970 [Acidimicrobiaceae bacterium]|nr:hypothetical protein [Acidimicrobiaceae bacterium]
MAGCLPQYFPVVGAALQAMSAPEFELHAVAASTGGAAILLAVNGPVRDEIGIHRKENLFGPGFRANATIGRTVRLVLRNCLMAIPGALDKSTQGWPGKYAVCDEDILVRRGTGPDDIGLMVGGGDVGGHSAFFPTRRAPNA